jgi:phosphatidylserine decarboxylase
VTSRRVAVSTDGGTGARRERGLVPDVSPDLPGMHWRAVLALLERMPQAAFSRGLGHVADIRLPRAFRRPVIGGFARAVGIDATEAEHDIADYASINEFFVRRLRPGARRWPDDAATVASPVDGIIGQHGVVADGRLIQAKGRDYRVADLLADHGEAGRYEGGAFITIYLSPRHYHRIHAPCQGRITSAHHLPGALLPVNEAAVQHVAGLFPRNERVACSIDAPFGRVAVVAVGAYNVGRISTAFDPDWAGPGRSVANRPGALPATRRYDPPITVAQGDEIMAFHLGSTVVMLCEPGLRSDVPPPGTEVRLGGVLLRADA